MRGRTAGGGTGLRVVRAEGSGDDALVACANELADARTPLVVVTADRGLRARLPAGMPVLGPGRLLAQLDGFADPSSPT